MSWQTEEGMPHKGILTCTYRSTAGGLQHWVLRMALTQVGGRKTTNGIYSDEATNEGIVARSSNAEPHTRRLVCASS